MRETTALGAAIAAGLAVGMWRNFAELRDINRAGGAVFEPQVSRKESAKSFALWEKAVNMGRGWVGDGKEPQTQSQIPNHEAKKAPEIIKVNDAMRIPSPKVNGEIIGPVKPPLFNICSDLDDADEEDLYLELRRVEILQRMKKMRKVKVTYL